MTPTPRHLQLHLFDANPDHALIPPRRRQRLLALISTLLSEVADNDRLGKELSPGLETVNE